MWISLRPSILCLFAECATGWPYRSPPVPVVYRTGAPEDSRLARETRALQRAICAICGVDIPCDGRTQVCSDACSERASEKNLRASHRRLRKFYEVRRCARCATPIPVNPDERNPRVTCSHACRQAIARMKKREKSILFPATG